MKWGIIFLWSSLGGKLMKSILDIALEEKRNLTENESYILLAEHAIAVPRYVVASSIEESIEKADSLGFPLVMKIISPDIIHKTDMGGVKLNIHNEQQLRKSYQDIMACIKKNKPEANITGVLLYKQLPEGIEIIIGMTRDPQFGPTVMFGLGGIFTEILQDVSFRICPIAKIDVEEMLNETKGIKVLQGYRGNPKSDIDAVIKIIIKISEIALQYSTIKEIDLNPVMVYEKGAVVVDGKVLLN